MKVRKRAESSTPAMPMTRSGGKPEASSATWHIASSGLVTTMMMASGEAAAACDTTARTMPAFLASRSSRLMPGWRARPGGDHDDVRAGRVGVVVGAPRPCSRGRGPGAASARSSALPCGRPSTMSTSTTSARPASAMRCAVVAPTLPAPMTVTSGWDMKGWAPAPGRSDRPGAGSEAHSIGGVRPRVVDRLIGHPPQTSRAGCRVPSGP